MEKFKVGLNTFFKFGYPWSTLLGCKKVNIWVVNSQTIGIPVTITRYLMVFKLFSKFKLQVQQIVRTDVMTMKLTGNCAAIHMASARKMIVGLTDREINNAIIHAGGLVNIQVKFLGKASKSFLIPHSSIRADTLSLWKKLCK